MAHVRHELGLAQLVLVLPLRLWAQVRRFSRGHIIVALVAAERSGVDDALVEDCGRLDAEDAIDGFFALSWRPRVELTRLRVGCILATAEVALLLSTLRRLDNLGLTVTLAKSVDHAANGNFACQSPTLVGRVRIIRLSALLIRHELGRHISLLLYRLLKAVGRFKA